MNEDAFTKSSDSAPLCSSCREMRLGNTLYRVVSKFNKELDWNGTLEKLAVRRAAAEPLQPPESGALMAEGMTS